MKIGILCLGKGSGISQCTYELAKAISKLAEVTCYLPTQNTMLSEFHGLPCPIREFNMQRGQKSFMLALLTSHEKSGIADSILRDAPDLVLDTGSGGWGRIIQLQLRKQLPLAEIVHDVQPHPDFRSIIDNIPCLLHPSMADVLIGLSEFSYKHLVSRYPHKAHIESRHGIILSNSNVDVDAVSRRRRNLLFFGRIDPYKGLGTLMTAYGIVKQSEPDIQLTVAGRGTITPKVITQMERLGVEIINRFVTDIEAREIVSRHGIMVLPYLSATQSGVAAVALANGLPCVATNVGAIPEQVLHEQNGLIVPPNNPALLAEAILRIANDPTEARAMSKEALRIGAECYSWDVIAAQLIDDLSGYVRN